MSQALFCSCSTCSASTAPESTGVRHDFVRVLHPSSQYGPGLELLTFSGPAATLRTHRGALVHVPVSPYPLMLAQAAATGRWEAATRLCRFVNDEALWASLAARALVARETTTAEAAYAALGQVSAYTDPPRRGPRVEGRFVSIA